MVCPHCGSTDWHELEDGRSRCLACFATYDVPKAAPAVESSQGVGKVDVNAPYPASRSSQGAAGPPAGSSASGGEGRRRFRA